MNTIKLRMRKLLSLIFLLSISWYSQAQECATWTEGCTNDGGYEWVITLAPGASINFGTMTPTDAWTMTQTGTNPEVWTVYGVDPNPGDILDFAIGSWSVSGPDCNTQNFAVGVDCLIDNCPNCASPACSITASTPSNVVCDDNGTPSDPSDDTFTFELLVNQSLGSASWTANDPAATSGNYGVLTAFGPFLIADGAVNLTITDDTNAGCTTTVSVNPPAACSNDTSCDITITAVTAGACNNQGTPLDPTDDTFEVTVNATVINGGAMNQFQVLEGTNILDTFDYDVGGIITIPSDGNTYTLTFIDLDDENCIETTTISQDPCCELDVETMIFPVTSSGATNGEIKLCINSGDGPFNISISPSVNESIYEVPGGCLHNYIIAGLPEGDYTITIEDANTCSFTSGTLTVGQPDCTGFMLSEISGTPVSCAGAEDGTMSVTLFDQGDATSITVDPGNGQAPVTFNDLDQPIELTGLPQGSYDVALFDNNGCEVTYLFNPVVISGPDPLVVTETTTDVTTVGGTDGSVQICVGGGNGGYAVTVDPAVGTVANNQGTCPDDGFLVSDLPAGNYEIVVADANGCADTLLIIVNDPDCSLDLNSTEFNGPDCGGDLAGSIMFDLNSGNYPYTITATNTNGETFNSVTEFGVVTLDGLPTGTYDILLEDGNGCQFSYNNIPLDGPSEMTLDTYIQNVSDNGQNNGAVDLCINGGNGGPYTINISPNVGTLLDNGTTSECDGSFSMEDLTAGVYDITVTDNEGCPQTFQVEVLEPSCATFTIDQVMIDSVSCYGANDGSVTIELDGGVAPFTYEIQGLQTVTTNDNTYTFNGLDDGEYQVFVTDANGCFAPYTIPVELFEPDPLSTVIAIIPPCAGESNGVICLVPQQGTPDYMYNVVNSDQEDQVVIDGPSPECVGEFHLNNVEAGVYHVELIDANGCIAHTITQVAEVTIGISGDVDNDCSNVDVGGVDINFGGGTPPYSFNWSNGATTEDISNVPAGDYTVTVTDARGCTGTAPFTVNLVDLELSFNIAATCEEQNAGAFITVVDSGVPAFDLVWTGDGTNGDVLGNTNNIITVSDLNIGNYAVTVTDGRGCTAEATTAVPEYDIEAQMTTLNTCVGENNGFVGTTPSTGIPDFVYNWSTGSNGGIITDLAPGTYTVTITDVNGCSAIGEGTVEEYELAATLDVQDVCSGENTGSITVNLTNSEGVISYEWSNGGVTNPLVGVGAGTYTVTATDALGCTVTASATVQEFESPTVEASEDVTIVQGESTVLSANASGGTGPYDYLWIPSNVANPTGSTTEASPSATTTYTIIATDANGCQATDTVLVTVVPEVRVVMPTAFSPNGDSNNEVYEPFVPGDAARVVTFQVFDRWGKLIHNDPSGPWDGKFKGTDQPVGTYVYVVEYLDLLDRKELIKGHFNLIR